MSIRKKNTGEPGNGGEFGTYVRDEAKTQLGDGFDPFEGERLSDTVAALLDGDDSDIRALEDARSRFDAVIAQRKVNEALGRLPEYVKNIESVTFYYPESLKADRPLRSTPRIEAITYSDDTEAYQYQPSKSPTFDAVATEVVLDVLTTTEATMLLRDNPNVNHPNFVEDEDGGHFDGVPTLTYSYR